ncbi:MAG: response regulator transcription factor [Paenibacillaceae bacterium]
MENRAGKILIVDDEDRIRTLLRMYLEKEGYLVEDTNDGMIALDRALHKDFDLIVLDVMLPGMNGIEICSNIRQIKETPILMLTARSDEDQRLDGFRAGADDYVTKPFSPREVTCRVNAIVSRSSAAAYLSWKKNVCTNLVFPHLVIEPDAHRVLVNGTKIQLTLKEYDLLNHMAIHYGKVFSREELLKEVWNYEFGVDFRTVDTHIKRVREKLNAASPEAALLIRTIWGVGYCLIDPEANEI